MINSNTTITSAVRRGNSDQVVVQPTLTITIKPQTLQIYMPMSTHLCPLLRLRSGHTTFFNPCIPSHVHFAASSNNHATRLSNTSDHCSCRRTPRHSCAPFREAQQEHVSRPAQRHHGGASRSAKHVHYLSEQQASRLPPRLQCIDQGREAGRGSKLAD
jgi:hypothetical protein